LLDSSLDSFFGRCIYARNLFVFIFYFVIFVLSSVLVGALDVVFLECDLGEASCVIGR